MKRIICVMLTLIMLVSLVPMTALTASAATLKTSEPAITVLKNMLTFRSKCYRVEDTNEYRIGYGTVCDKTHKLVDESHTINQTAADEALRGALTKLDAKVNNFASGNSLSLKQNQFDALAVFSYLYGTAWMNGSGTVKTAVTSKASATELLNAMKAFSGSESRSKILVNMYMNNVYSNDLPSSYSTVTYDANDGTMAQGDSYTMYFDASVSTDHVPVPTKNGAKFLGWYFQDSNNKATGRSTELNSSCKEKILIAVWQDNSVSSDKPDGAPAVNFNRTKSQLASSYVYNGPNGEKVGNAPDSMTVTNEYLSSNGSRWGKIGTGKWVMLNGIPGSSDSSSSSRVKVFVTNSYVNVRKEASIYAAQAGSLKLNDYVYISRTENANGFLWGKAYEHHDSEDSIGWIALMYTDYNTAKNNQPSSSDTSSTSKAIATATVTYNGYVNMRSGAGTDNKIVGALGTNQTVELYEIKTVNGHQWGRTDSGWFCLTYASVKMLSGSSDISNEGSQAYTFTGKVKEDVSPYVDATSNSNHTSTKPASGSTVSIITLKLANNLTWAKIGWTVTENKKTVNKYGWVDITPKARTVESADLASNTTPISLNTVKFTVVADSVTVRASAGSGENTITKLNKGYQFNVNTIKLVNEEIWGRVENSELTGGIELTGGEDPARGWVNLASKYVKRADQVDKPTTPSTSTQLVAKVINTDKVNVRSDSKVTATKVGTLARGTVANVLKERDGWYKLDIDVDNDPETSSWVSGDYLEITNGSSTNGNLNAPSSTGTGIVANTYSGVNVRTGAGTAYASTGKLLPGTQVEILDTKFVGTTKWGRTSQGWVCMDYISMITENVQQPEAPKDPSQGTIVGSYDDVEKTTTTAVYTGTVNGTVTVWAETQYDTKNSTSVRELADGDNVTIYELLAVTEKTSNENQKDDDGNDTGNTTETVVTSYWARVNDGYIRNPQTVINLDSLDEKTHTLTGSETLNVRPGTSYAPTIDGTPLGKLERGDKVKVTRLFIEKDKVWGRIEYKGETGWIRLDYMSEGAYTEQKQEQTPVEPPKAPSIGNTGNTGNGGFVTNNGGYLYTGKIINSDGVKVRATASTSASVTTTMNKGQALVIYETTIADNRAWGRCDAGWIYLYYVDLTPENGALDARVVYNDNTVIYTDSSCSETTGSTYAKMSVIDIYEVVGKMARTEEGWVNTDNLL